MSQFVFQSGPEEGLPCQIQDIHRAMQYLVHKMELMQLQHERATKQLRSQLDSFRDEVAHREMQMQLEIERLKLKLGQTSAVETSREAPEPAAEEPSDAVIVHEIIEPLSVKAEEPESGDPEAVGLPCQSMEELALFMKDKTRVKMIAKELSELEPMLVFRNIFRKVLIENLWHLAQIPKRNQPPVSIDGRQKHWLPWTFVNWSAALYCSSCSREGIANMPEHFGRKKLQSFLYERRKTHRKQIDRLQH